MPITRLAVTELAISTSVLARLLFYFLVEILLLSLIGNQRCFLIPVVVCLLQVRPVGVKEFVLTTPAACVNVHSRNARAPLPVFQTQPQFRLWIGPAAKVCMS